jgi:hypothetical protein
VTHDRSASIILLVVNLSSCIKHWVDFCSVVEGWLLHGIVPLQRVGISEKVMAAPAGVSFL